MQHGDAGVTAAADAAKSLGGDYAPMVALALAGMAVAGGSKAWSYYRDRAEQKHEQELEREQDAAEAVEGGAGPKGR